VLSVTERKSVLHVDISTSCQAVAGSEKDLNTPALSVTKGTSFLSLETVSTFNQKDFDTPAVLSALNGLVPQPSYHSNIEDASTVNETAAI